MSTYPSHYETETQIREREQAAAPQECPHCHEPINQNMGRWDKPRQHCGSDRCRKAASRANLAERKRQERADARKRVLEYCERQLPQEQKHAVMDMTDVLMTYDYEHGHQIALQVVKVIEGQRCKHDRIDVLIENAKIAQRRSEEAYIYNKDLQELYKHRIAILEAEVETYRLLQGSIDKIATEQLRKQIDPPLMRPAPPELEPEDEDRAHTLAILIKAGIKPYTGGQSEDEEMDEDEEDSPEE